MKKNYFSPSVCLSGCVQLESGLSPDPKTSWTERCRSEYCFGTFPHEERPVEKQRKNFQNYFLCQAKHLLVKVVCSFTICCIQLTTMTVYSLCSSWNPNLDGVSLPHLVQPFEWDVIKDGVGGGLGDEDLARVETDETWKFGLKRPLSRIVDVDDDPDVRQLFGDDDDDVSIAVLDPEKFGWKFFFLHLHLSKLIMHLYLYRSWIWSPK